MKLLLLIAALFFASVIKSQPLTYTVDSVKYNPQENIWIDSSSSYIGNMVTIDFKLKQIVFYPDKKYLIVGLIGNGTQNKDGETILMYRCVDYNGKACRIYYSMPNNDAVHCTIFIQYERTNFMYYIKAF